MTDIHCHILAGIDDGPIDIKESIEMANIAYADGIEKIVATPHITTDNYSPEHIEEKVIELNYYIKDAGISCEILAGGEVSIINTPEVIKRYCINKTKYVLIELPNYISSLVKETLFKLVTDGIVPIISHPERNFFIINGGISTIEELIKSGCLIQITAESLTGTFGENVKIFSIYLLKKGYVHVIASDAHGIKYRRPVLSPAIRIAEKFIGKEKTLKLVNDNPISIINNQTIS